MRKQIPRYKRGQPAFLLVATLIALLLSSAPVTVPTASVWAHETQINSLEYKQQFGKWDVVDIPEEFRTNTIHAAALPTGKILLVAGSGNNEKLFNEYHNEGKIAVLATAIYDPSTNAIKKISTPSDLFCSGHAQLQTGNLLIAGGTSGYEVLDNKVTKPAGSMLLHNEDPDSSVKTYKKGTRFTDDNGRTYISTQEVKLQPAMKMDLGDGNVMVHHSTAKVFVEAITSDPSFETDENLKYKIEGLTGSDADNIYGQGGPMTLKKQDYRGDNKAYEFDPTKEEYVKVGDMKESRWYPSLPVLTDGQVLAVSGLDSVGQITDTTEYYSTESKKWTMGPTQKFPTYPALFRTSDPDVLFFSGSSAGYGPTDAGRKPGFWNVKSDTFKPVPNIRDANLLETSASVYMPPVKGSNDGTQSQKIMVAGGGGIGESNLSTARTDVIDLSVPNPMFTPGPDLPAKLRYPNMTVTPWDEIFTSGGSVDYRAKENSYSFKSFSIDQSSNTLKPMADEIVGRTYHSGSLLLQDGRILSFGGDPLYSDKNNTVQGKFEQRMEIYTPPQFFKSTRPVLEGADKNTAIRGEKLKYTSTNARSIRTARLIPPSSTTHVTNIEQRSVAAVVTTDKNNVSVALPQDKNVLPRGWYMLFVVNGDGMPSAAKMIYIKE